MHTSENIMRPEAPILEKNPQPEGSGVWGKGTQGLGLIPQPYTKSLEPSLCDPQSESGTYKDLGHPSPRAE